MNLVSFEVTGFRCLAATGVIPLGRPTVLTGANAGGKTACLDALGYLLGDHRLSDDDLTRTPSTSAEGAITLEVATQTAVIGTFDLTEEDRELLAVDDGRIDVRRVRRDGEHDTYEMFATVPQEPLLRGLGSLNRTELRQRAQELGVEPSGDARRPEAWREPLRTLAAAGGTTQAWVPAPAALTSRLPRLLRFSSTREPELRSEIHQALRGAFEQLLDEDSIVGQVREAERQLQQRLQDAADDLCAHVLRRCPELVDIHVSPSVSFREGFQQVAVHVGTQAGIDVPLEYSGAGRRRRMTLAVWEWTRDLLADPGERAVVIAYDEPDTHLDYANQRDLVELIRDQSTRDSVRVLVATHSLNLIDKVDIADVVHLQLVDGHTRVSRLLSDEHQEVNRHLAAISAAMGLRNSVLLHERVFVAVEGSTEAQALPILFRLVVGMSLQSSGIALIAGNNNRGALDVARWLASHNREVQFIIDRDSTQDRSTRSLFTPEKLRAVGIRPDQMHLLGDPGEIEDLFTDDLWARTANEAWPRRDGEDWKPTDIGELRGEGKFSNKLLALAREQSEQGPSTKTECLVELATRLTDPDEVPEQLRECFRQLVELAAGDYSVDHAPG